MSTQNPSSKLNKPLQPELGIWKPASRAGILAEESLGKVLRQGSGVCAHYHWVINSYTGCKHGCSYCYAINFVPDPEKQQSWGQWVKYKSGALSEIKKALPKLTRTHILMSSATDPYQPIETELQITRGILKIFADLPPNQQPFLHIITRSPYVTRDIDLLQRLHRKIITLSFPTDDDEVRKALEPHAPSIPTRWQTLEKLAAANIPTSINFCPIIRINFPKETAQKIKTLQVKRVLWDVPHNRPNTNNGFVGTTPNNGWETLKKIGWTEEESILAQTRLSTALKEAKAP